MLSIRQLCSLSIVLLLILYLWNHVFILYLFTVARRMQTLDQLLGSPSLHFADLSSL